MKDIFPRYPLLIPTLVAILLIGIPIIYLARPQQQKPKEPQEDEQQQQSQRNAIEYICSKSGVEYLKTNVGIAVHVYESGTPVKCDRWKGYNQ